MTTYTRYQKLQKYYLGEPVSPPEYKQGQVVGVGDWNSIEECLGYTIIWKVVPNEYICERTDVSGTYEQYEKLQAYYKEVDKPVEPASYKKGQLIETGGWDSLYDCENPPIYRWNKVPGLYVCEEDKKYELEIKQVSKDKGKTWTDVVPNEYRKGNYVGDCDGVLLSFTSTTNVKIHILPLDGFIDLWYQEVNKLHYRKPNPSSADIVGDYKVYEFEPGTHDLSVGYNIFNKSDYITSSGYTIAIDGAETITFNENYSGIFGRLYFDQLSFYGHSRLKEINFGKIKVYTMQTLYSNKDTMAAYKGCYDFLFQKCTQLTEIDMGNVEVYQGNKNQNKVVIYNMGICEDCTNLTTFNFPKYIGSDDITRTDMNIYQMFYDDVCNLRNVNFGNIEVPDPYGNDWGLFLGGLAFCTNFHVTVRCTSSMKQFLTRGYVDAYNDLVTFDIIQ